MAGLLGVTVIGAVLRARQAGSLRGGATPSQAFLDGYHTGLWVTIALLTVGVVLSYITLRPGGPSRRESADTEVTAGEASTLSPQGVAGM